jgi:hypothetical protein
MAERGNPEVKRTFEHIGGRAEKKTDLGNMLRAKHKLEGAPDKGGGEKGGHPDYHWMVPPMGGYVEAKAARRKDGAHNFQFEQIELKQREWLNGWSAISWLWLWYGEVPPTYQRDPARRRAYLIHWPMWLHYEKLLTEAGLCGLAFLQAHRLEHRQAGLQAVDLLAAHELTWAGDRTWDIPPTHPFWTVPLAQVSLFAPRCLHMLTPSGEAYEVP